MDELNKSELGTLEFWDKRYSEEINNFKSFGDLGEIWFGEGIIKKIIKWMEDKTISKSSKIIDIGCGNAMFLINLAEKGYTNLYGVDYSQRAIELAQLIVKSSGYNIKLETCDVLENLNGIFNIIHDKGTYDAISLSSDIKENRKKYLNNIFNSLKDGFFIITSCNWTKDELNEQFKEYFLEFDSISTSKFQFGGKSGNVVTTVIYKRQKIL